MPTLKGITVHISTNSMRLPEEPNKQLQEWGLQYMARHNTASCYVQSETGLRFQVTIQPQLPYLAEHYETTQGIGTRSGRPNASNRTSHQSLASSALRDSNVDRRNALSGPVRVIDIDSGGPANETGHNHNKRSHGIAFKPVRSGRLKPLHSSSGQTPPTFHLLATLYLDGRKVPERRVIVYLDQTHPEFRQPNGTTGLNTRWVEGRDGKLREYCWQFNDVGIETLFDRLVLTKESSQATNPLNVDELSAAMIATDLTSEKDDLQEEKLQLGQIVVELQRVTVGKTYMNHHFHPRHREGDDEDMNMTGLDQVSHTTSVGSAAKKPLSSSIPVIHYYPYVRGEALYARFQFFYRSQEKLQKFNFPDFLTTMPSKSTIWASRRTRNNITSRIASMSSLGATTVANKQAMPPRSQQAKSCEKRNSKHGLTKERKDALDSGESWEWSRLEMKARRSIRPLESRKDSTTCSTRSASPACSDASTIIVDTRRNKAPHRSSAIASVSGLVSSTWDGSTTSERNRLTSAGIYHNAAMDAGSDQDTELWGSSKLHGERLTLHQSGYESDNISMDESSGPDIDQVGGRPGKRARSLDGESGGENQVKIPRRASISVTGIRSARDDIVKALNATDLVGEGGLPDITVTRPMEERKLLLGDGGNGGVGRTHLALGTPGDGL